MPQPQKIESPYVFMLAKFLGGRASLNRTVKHEVYHFAWPGRHILIETDTLADLAALLGAIVAGHRYLCVECEAICRYDELVHEINERGGLTCRCPGCSAEILFADVISPLAPEAPQEPKSSN